MINVQDADTELFHIPPLLHDHRDIIARQFSFERLLGHESPGIGSQCHEAASFSSSLESIRIATVIPDRS